MLARLQIAVVMLLLGASITWAGYCLSLGRGALALAGAVAILLGYALFLGAEFAMLYFVQHDDVAPRPSVLQVLRAWCGEVVSAPRVFFWRQPFRSRAEPDELAPHPDGRPGVILVHGFVCNRGLWNPWMRALRARRTSFIAVNLEPLFGSIDAYPRLIEAAVSRMEAATGVPVVLVGHSMGGLAIRAWLAQFDADARVRRVVTIGSPHRGTWLARHAHTTNGRQMRLGSPWLTQLAAREPASRLARFTCFYGHCDNIVFPAASGTLAGAHNLHVEGTAHVHMAFQDAVLDEVWRWLEPGVATPVAARPDPTAMVR